MSLVKEEICLNCCKPTIEDGKCNGCGCTIDEMKKKHYEDALEPGTILRGKYLVGKALGCGGFGITYIGMDMVGQRRVAIKECYLYNICRRGDNGKRVLVKDLKDKKLYSEAAERFVTEAALLKENRDMPGIIQIYDIFQENATQYYVMEYLQGTDLKEYLSLKKILSWEETEKIFEPVFTSLISLHRFNIWHRDISPDNIFLCDDGQVRLIDFGSARVGLLDKSHGVDAAKKGYAPIEQYDERLEQGTWTDVYSLAASIYRCLTGTVPPYAIDRMRKDNCSSLSKYVEGIPAYVDDAVMKALEVYQENRYQTIAEFKCALYPDSQTMPLADRIVEELPLKAIKVERELNVRLLGLEGYHKGMEFPIDETVTFGRREDTCQIVFPQYMPGVSGVHCSVRFDEERKVCILHDKNSTYGTRDLGGAHLEQGKDIYLSDGDGFIIGEDNIFAVLFY